MTSSVFSLERRIDVFAVSDFLPTNITGFRAERLVSYNNGDSWSANWITSENGIFQSSLAASITGDGLDTFLVGRRNDDKFYFARLPEYYEFRSVNWNVIGKGVFDGKPAICSYGNTTSEWLNKDNITTTYQGVRVMVFGKGRDKKYWWASSVNGGASWHMAWSPIGKGVFTSSPAATCSANGNLVAVFGKGNDDRIWWAYSTNGANTWDMAWAPIGSGVFTSAPAAACSADGKRIYVFGRGKDNRYWWAYAVNGVQRWNMAWAPIGEGVFTSMPSANCSWDGRIIHVFGLGTDKRIWQARSNNFGASWDIAWRKIHSKKFINI